MVSGCDLGVATQLGHEPPLRGDDRWVGDPAGPVCVDDHLLRGERAGPERGLHDLQPARGLRRDGDAAVVAAGQVQVGRRQRERDQDPGRETAPQAGPAHDGQGEAVPPAGDVLSRSRRSSTLRGITRQAVHAASHHRQDGRQEGGRGGDRDERDEHAAHAHRAHERHGHEDEQPEADGHGQAREQRGAPGGGHRLDQCGVRVVVELELLAIAEDDEHRVVDRDREADQRDDVRHVDGHVHGVGEDPHEAERRGDAHEGEDERHDDAADRAEHERHHEDRDGHGDRLALAEVLVVDRLCVVVERGIAGQVGLGARARCRSPCAASASPWRRPGSRAASRSARRRRSGLPAGWRPRRRP